MAWRSDEVTVSIVSSSPQGIHAVVTPSGKNSWLLSVIYASTLPLNINRYWHELSCLPIDKLPWLVMGDFNCIINPDRKPHKLH